MLPIKLFRLVFCLFRFNLNIETLCFGIEVKQPNKLFRNKQKQTGKTQNFLKKYQNKLLIILFRLLFCLFRFNGNTETLCLGIEAKQPKQMFCSDSAKTSFSSSFGCFESKLVSKDTLIQCRWNWPQS